MLSISTCTVLSALPNSEKVISGWLAGTICVRHIRMLIIIYVVFDWVAVVNLEVLFVKSVVYYYYVTRLQECQVNII